MLMKVKKVAKQFLPPVAFDLLKKLYSVYNNNVIRKYEYKKLSSLINDIPEIEKLFPTEKMKEFYVHLPMQQTKERPILFMSQIRYYRMYQFLLDNYPELFDDKVSVVDVGDTTGIFFRAMKRSGFSVNIDRDAVNLIRQNGIEAEVGDIEKLPFKDKSFEYAFCFQCIEHVVNPIQALKELSRITQKKIFLSIPHVDKTTIQDPSEAQGSARKKWSEVLVRDTDYHKFMFSAGDFKKIVKYVSLRCCDNFPINYFKPLGSVCKNEGSYFNFFILEPLR